MAEEIDFNDAIEDIFLSEEATRQESYDEGFKAGTEAGNPVAYHTGYHKGFDIGERLGFWLEVTEYYIQLDSSGEVKHPEKTLKQLMKVKCLIDAFPRSLRPHDDDIVALSTEICTQYKRILETVMCSFTINKLQQQLDSVLGFIKPLLPLANCHMVEFFTQSHWQTLIPEKLRLVLEDYELEECIDKFWSYSDKTNDNCEVSQWIKKTRSHCVVANHDYCISKEQLQKHIVSWGGSIKPEIKIKEFMNSKKSYEVQTMSSLVASLHSACSATCCVEAGGGRGHLPVALTLGYAIPSLTIDCNETAIRSAKERVKIIQKQWHAIAKNINSGNEEKISNTVKRDLHQFASGFITESSDLVATVQEKFPEHSQIDTKLLLTGLHTCGNLGPDSLRIFTRQPSTAAVFNVPCCYHLLTETVDTEFFDVFQKDYGIEPNGAQGFPMSGHLRGFNLGRNARMLAAQTFDRVVVMKQWPSKTLLYRALLQVVIKKHLPDFHLSDGKLKRLTKCQDFDQYFKMADGILKLELYDKLPNGYVDDFCKHIDLQYKHIVFFYLVRLCLAQVIESVILLDRLLYLYENGFQKVYLVKLFDPVLSPRCHSIVAVR